MEGLSMLRHEVPNPTNCSSLAHGHERPCKMHARYLAVDQHDLAINMYKKREEYEQMLRLVSKHRHELLADTYKHIAEQYELKGIVMVAVCRCLFWRSTWVLWESWV